MPSAPVPADVDEFLRKPNQAVIASLRRDGSPHTVATWYLWEENRVLVSMDESRLRLQHLRRDPRVALTVLGDDDGDSHVSLLGRVVELNEDAGLRDIDRLAVHYTGRPFRNRERRRFSAWVAIDAWHGWVGSKPWPVD